MFWPRPGVIFANKATYDALTSDQQDILRRAGVRALAESVDAHPRRGPRGLPDDLCKRGVKMIDASEGTLAELRAAVQPVYDEIEKDPGTKATIDAIEALSASSKVAPDAVKCNVAVTTPSPEVAAAVSPIDGTWRVCYTLDELMAAGAEQSENQPGNAGCGTKTFRKGQFWELGDGGLFDPGRPNGTFGESLDGNPDLQGRTGKTGNSSGASSLTRSPSRRLAPAATGFVVKPFHKVADLAKPTRGNLQDHLHGRRSCGASPLLYGR